MRYDGERRKLLEKAKSLGKKKEDMIGILKTCNR